MSEDEIEREYGPAARCELDDRLRARRAFSTGAEKRAFVGRLLDREPVSVAKLTARECVTAIDALRIR